MCHDCQIHRSKVRKRGLVVEQYRILFAILVYHNLLPHSRAKLTQAIVDQNGKPLSGRLAPTSLCGDRVQAVGSLPSPEDQLQSCVVATSLTTCRYRSQIQGKSCLQFVIQL